MFERWRLGSERLQPGSGQAARLSSENILTDDILVDKDFVKEYLLSCFRLRKLVNPRIIETTSTQSPGLP